MEYRFSGETSSIAFDLADGIDLVVPDDGNVNYTIRGNSGSVLLSGVLNAVVTDRIKITLPSAQMTKVADVERRIVEISYLRNSVLLTLTKYINLINRPLLSHGPEDVRAFIGSTRFELPDEDIDLARAYAQVRSEASAAVFDSAISSGSNLQTAADDAILYKAILNVLPGIAVRLAAKEQGDNISFQRMDGKVIDLVRMTSMVANLYSEAFGVVTLSGNFDPVFFVVNTPVDPITGV